MPVISKITGAPFRFWCQKILPAVYDDSLSYYELLCKAVDYLNKVMEDDISITNLVNQLEEFVNNYFNNLDVQEEINNKLDDMAENGELYALIERFTQPIIDEINNNITAFESATNERFNETDTAIQNQSDNILVLESRMDGFSSLPDGSLSTSADAELVDIRVSTSGLVYPTAGDAVRAQVKNSDANYEENKYNIEQIINGDYQYLNWNSRTSSSNYWLDTTTTTVKRSTSADVSYGTYEPMHLKAGTYYLHMISDTLTFINTTKLSDYTGYTAVNTYNGTLNLSQDSTIYITTYHPSAVRWSYSMLSTSMLTTGTTATNNSYRYGYYNAHIVADNVSERLYSVSVKEYAGNTAKIQYCKSSERTTSSYWNYYDNIMHIGSSNNYWRFEPIYIPAGTYYGYYISAPFTLICTYDNQFTKMTDYTGYTENGVKSKLVLNNDSCLYITGTSAETMLFNYDETDNAYKDFGIFDTDGLHKKIEVGTGKPYTTITSALASIPAGTWLGNQYDVIISTGTYAETEIRPADGVNLIGSTGNRNDVIISGALEPNATNQQIEGTCTIVLVKSNTLKNITVKGKNLRYPIHSESGGVYKNWIQKLYNVAVIHEGNEEVVQYRTGQGDTTPVWDSTHAWGEGASANSYAEFINCYFEGGNAPFYIHDSTATDSNMPYKHVLNNCKMVNNDPDMLGVWNTAVIIDNAVNRGCTNNIIEMNDCSFGNGSVRITNTYPIFVYMHGCNNVPVRVDTPANGYPETDYVTVKKYIGSTALQNGDILKYDKHVNYVSLADQTTPIELIAGMYIGGGAVQGDLVQVISKTYQNVVRGTAVGTMYYVNASGKLVTSGTIPVSVSLGEFSKLL